jgi:hypothetical protein
MPHPESPIQDPYLGRKALHGFDLMIVAAMDLNTKVAKSTHSRSLSRLQRAGCQLLPNGFAIALSVRELIRAGYLFSAEILLRPLIERVAVLSYLMVSGDSALDLWECGWPHKSRPSLKTMLDTIKEYDDFPGEESIRDLTKALIDQFNSVVHADPQGLDSNIGTPTTGNAGYLSGANLSDPERCDNICHIAVIYMSFLMKRAVQIFPDFDNAGETLH